MVSIETDITSITSPLIYSLTAFLAQVLASPIYGVPRVEPISKKRDLIPLGLVYSAVSLGSDDNGQAKKSIC